MKVVFLEKEDGGGWWYECAFTFKFALNLMTNIYLIAF